MNDPSPADAATDRLADGLSSLGGRTTLLAGAGFLLLQIVTIAAIATGVMRMDAASAAATRLDAAAAELDRLHRGVMEVVITDGSNGSRVLVRTALGKLDAFRGTGILDGAIAEAGTSWEKVSASATLFANGKDMSVSNINALVALGKFDQVTQKLDAALAARAETARTAAELAERSTLFTVALAGGLNVLGTTLIYWMFYRRVTRPLRSATSAAALLAAGDFTRDIGKHGGEATALLHALARLQVQLGGMLGQIRLAADAVLRTSGELAQGNTHLSARTEAQASTLEQTASSLEELTSTVRQNADHGRQVDQLAGDAARSASEAGRVVDAMVQKMAVIADSSHRIADITGIIDGIAFQTNILALNAAVEAARAGEQGRGFAVVAAEVRSLAQRSAAAAREIKGLVVESRREVDSGAQLVRGASESMATVVASVTRVTALVADMARAGQEQGSGIEQVNAAVTQMDSAVQQNAALVQQAAEATALLNGEAERLIEMVSRFRLRQSAATSAENMAPEPRGAFGLAVT